MAAHPARRLRFSLRTLLVVVTIICVSLGLFGREANVVRKRLAALREIDIEGGGSSNWGFSRYIPREFPCWRYWLGDDDVAALNFHEPHALKLGIAKIDEIIALFPEVHKVWISKPEPKRRNYFDPFPIDSRLYPEWRAKHTRP